MANPKHWIFYPPVAGQYPNQEVDFLTKWVSMLSVPYMMFAPICLACAIVFAFALRQHHGHRGVLQKPLHSMAPESRMPPGSTSTHTI